MRAMFIGIVGLFLIGLELILLDPVGKKFFPDPIVLTETVMVPKPCRHLEFEVYSERVDKDTYQIKADGEWKVNVESGRLIFRRR